MFTRQQYMSKEVTYEQYMEQFVTPSVLNWVKRAIGIEAIKASGDANLNDIPLYKWDAFYNTSEFAGPVARALRDSGDVNARSIANACCVAKTAARMLVKESQS